MQTKKKERAKKFVPNKNGGHRNGGILPMSTQHPHQIHEQRHRCWVDIGSIPPFLCPLFYLDEVNTHLLHMKQIWRR